MNSSIVARIKKTTVRVLALTVLFGATGPLVAATKVAVYGLGATGFANRLTSLDYDTTRWTTPSQVSASSLATIDVLYVHSTAAPELSTKQSVIADWTAQGHGLIVEQPNAPGLVLMMPPTLSVKISSAFYDGSTSGPDPIRDIALTSAGLTHAITAGLTAQDICENADKILISDISPAWSVLAVQASDPNYMALASANYGAGRVFFHTGNTSPTAFTPGSDLYVHRMIDWVAVPEPGAVLLLSSCVYSVLPSRFRRSNRLRAH